MPSPRRVASSSLRQSLQDRRGQATVEFALAALLLFALIFGAIELARATWIYGTTAHLAREGARFAMVRGSESPQTASAGDVETYVLGRAADMAGLTVSTTWEDASKDPGTAVVVQVTRPFSPVATFLGIPDISISSRSRMFISF